MVPTRTSADLFQLFLWFSAGTSVWWLVVPYGCLMLIVAAIEAASRPTQAYRSACTFPLSPSISRRNEHLPTVLLLGRWMLTHSLISMGAAVTSVMTYMLLVVIHMKPWWSAQVLISPSCPECCSSARPRSRHPEADASSGLPVYSTSFQLWACCWGM